MGPARSKRGTSGGRGRDYDSCPSPDLDGCRAVDARNRKPSALYRGARVRGRGLGTDAERILCLGESTTAPTDRPDHSWPRQLEAILNERSGSRRFAVINAGRSSTNSALLLARLPGLLDVYTPQTVVVAMGINDPKWYGVLETADRRAGGWRGFMAGLRVWKLARYVRYELLRGTLLDTTLAGGARHMCCWRRN